MGSSQTDRSYFSWAEWLVLLCMFGGMGILAFWFPLSPAFRQVPLADIRTFAPSLLEGVIYAILICFLYALYGVAAWRAWRQKRPLPLLVLIVTTIILAAPLLFTFPINANDIYRYVIRGRITGLYGENPFLLSPTAFPADPFLPLAGEWANFTTPYGPLWEMIAALLVSLSRDNLLFGLLLFKLVGLAGHLGTAVLLYFLARSSKIMAAKTAVPLLWAWNPALLLIFVMDAHNDSVMIFWLVLGVLIIQRQKPLAGFLVMVLALLTKPIALLALPVFFIALLRQKKDWYARASFSLLAAAGSVLLIAAAFFPFGSPLPLLQRLQTEAAAGAGFSLPALLILIGQNINRPSFFSLIKNLFLAAFLLIFVWVLWQTWRGRRPVRSVGDVFAAYILQALNFRIWYAAWPFPWTLLEALQISTWYTHYRLRAAWWFLLTAQLSVVIYGHVRIHLLQSNQVWAHLFGVPFTLGLPLLLALWPMNFRTIGN